MPELLICPECKAHCYFRATNKQTRTCYWCKYQFSLADRLKALKLASKKSYRKLATEIGVKQRTFENWTTGRVVPDHENMAKIEVLFLKYFTKKNINDFVAE